MQTDARPVLEVQGITKEYPGVRALADVDLAIRPGEVRALMGLNGAGKSTLVKVLGGVTTPTRGRVVVDGSPVDLGTPSDAQHHGIGTVHQELSLVPGLSVAENITLGRWPRRRIAGVSTIDGRAVQSRAREVLDQLGEPIALGRPVGSLSAAQQQLVEIAKALSFAPKVLILDEPTSSLAHHEVDGLLRLVRRLAEQGVAIVYVSHRMDEIPQIADTVTVLRDGRVVDTAGIAERPTAVIARMMSGDDLRETAVVTSSEVGEVLLEVEGLTRPGAFEDVSFTVRAGEVVGLAGLMGSGRTEVLRALFGVDRVTAGTVRVQGRTLTRRTPRAMIRAGVGLMPEDRKGQGLVLGLPVEENLVMTCYDRIRSHGILSAGRRRRLAQGSIDRLGIAVRDPGVSTHHLSGGNQQKVVVGKWLNRRTRLLLMDEPTRGVDVHAKAQLYELVAQLSRDGAGVLFVSSEMEEIARVCHRVLVLRRGRVAAELPVSRTDVGELLTLAMGEAGEAS